MRMNCFNKNSSILLIVALIISGSSIVSADHPNHVATSNGTAGTSPPISKLMTCDSKTKAECSVPSVAQAVNYAAQRLKCPTCTDFGKSNGKSLDEIQLQETCSPANDPLDVPTTSGFASEPLNFTLAPGEYAELTTINPNAEAGTVKSCIPVSLKSCISLNSCNNKSCYCEHVLNLFHSLNFFKTTID